MQEPGFPQQPCKIWEMTRAQHRAGSRFLALLTPGAMVIFPCAYRTPFCIYLSFAIRQNTKSTATPHAGNKNDDRAGCKDAWKPPCPHTRPPVPPSHTPTPKPQNGAAQKQGRNTPHVYIPRHCSFPPKTASGPSGPRGQTSPQPNSFQQGPLALLPPSSISSCCQKPKEFLRIGCKAGI